MVETEEWYGLFGLFGFGVVVLVGERAWHFGELGRVTRVVLEVSRVCCPRNRSGSESFSVLSLVDKREII